MAANPDSIKAYHLHVVPDELLSWGTLDTGSDDDY